MRWPKRDPVAHMLGIDTWAWVIQEWLFDCANAIQPSTPENEHEWPTNRRAWLLATIGGWIQEWNLRWVRRRPDFFGNHLPPEVDR